MSGDRHWRRAQAYLADNQLVAARIALESVVQRDPEFAEAYLALSHIAWAENRLRESIECALLAYRKLGDHPPATLACDTADALLRSGESVASKACVSKAEAHAAIGPDVLLRLASLRMQLGEHAQSLALLDRAATAGASGAFFHYQRGLELTYNGRLDEAAVEHETALLADPSYGRSALALSRLRKQTAESNHVASWTERVKLSAPGSDDNVSLHFALYKELEDLGRYEEAWQALTQGNRLQYQRQTYDAQHAWALFRGLMARSTAEVVRPEDIRFDGPQPIFIIGMPRSGTTLLERILGNHSQVESAGELDDFGRQVRWSANQRTTLDERLVELLPDLDFRGIGQRYLEQTQWRAKGAAFYIDKLPRNWMVAGIIRRALPQARILHLVREPMDVCFSNYRAFLGDAFAYSYDLEALAAHYLQYRSVMAHWHQVMPGQILDVSYAELVRDSEKVAREVCNFCGLAWEPHCVDIARNKTAVATLSMAQVREPIHTRSFSEWRPYEHHLGGLQAAIAAGGS